MGHPAPGSLRIHEPRSSFPTSPKEGDMGHPAIGLNRRKDGGHPLIPVSKAGIPGLPRLQKKETWGTRLS